jgi:hypothetical protein
MAAATRLHIFRKLRRKLAAAGHFDTFFPTMRPPAAADDFSSLCLHSAE